MNNSIPVVIFGAGASYDVADPLNPPNLPAWKPLLTDKIFLAKSGNANGILARYKTVDQILSKIRYRLESGQSLEGILLDIKNEGKNKEALISIQYFLSEFFLGCSTSYLSSGNNYAHLINELRNKYGEVCLLTFNYDLFIEQAIESCFGFKIRQINDYLSSSYKLIKLHGSCNWFLEFSIPKDKGIPISVDEIGHYAIARNIDLLDYKNYFNLDIHINNEAKYIYKQSHTFFHPQLAIPINEKSSFICPESHLKVAKDYLSKTNHLILVGWRGNEDQFKELLKDCIGERGITLTIINFDNDADLDITNRKSGTKEVLENMESTGIKFKNVKIFKKGFSAFLSEQDKNNYDFLNC